MKLKRTAFLAAIGLFLTGTMVFAGGPPPATNTIATPAPVAVPEVSHANDPLPDGIIAWDELSKSTDAAADQLTAQLVFNLTNIAKTINLGLATNVISITNLTTVTNSRAWARFWGKKITRVASIASHTNLVTVTNSITPISVTILSVHPSCGCTTAELPPLPWTMAPGASGQIRFSVNLLGKSGTLFKSASVSTDQGSKTLQLRVNIQASAITNMTEVERARGVAAAKVDRQAVFHDDCARCHANHLQGKYGKQLYDSLCAICHEAAQRATMVPDLRNLKTPTNDEFWRTWVAHGKPGSLMPAFAASDGGPLSDVQVASVAAYLDLIIPSAVPVKK